jgi:Mrp family chromosome partitioning ATPase
MDKLEAAIRQTARSDFNLFEKKEDIPDCSINEISRMETKKLLTNTELESKKIVYQGSEQFELLHQLRDIRTALATDKSNNIVMVTSLAANHGVSFFARNLAAVTAFDLSKTSILIDCNTGKPSISNIFELGEATGVMDYIEDDSLDMDSVIHCSGIKRYRCIPAGTIKHEGEEYFTHPRFKKLLSSLKNRYKDRNVILDAPPILRSADARILLEVCDKVIVVVPYGKVSTNELVAAGQMIPAEKYAGVVYSDYICK